jgi:WD40 repeat protein
MRASSRLFAALSLVLAAQSARAADVPTDLYGDPLPPGAVARLGSVRLRHQATAIAFAPDGKTFATAGVDQMIRLWSAADGKEIRALKGHATITFSADGKKLYFSGEGKWREWDVVEGKELRALTTAPQPFALALAVHPTEPRWLALENGSVREWDLKEGKLLRTVAVPKPSGLLAALCPDAKHFAVFKDNRVTLRDLDDKEVQRFPVGSRRVERLTFSADGTTLAAACAQQTVLFWDVKTGREIRTLTEATKITAPDMSLSASGRTFAVFAGRSVRIFDVASGQELRCFDAPVGGRLVFSPDDKRLAILRGKSILLWDLETGRTIPESTGHSGDVIGVRFSPDGTRVTSVSLEGTATWWDATTGRSVASWIAGSTGVMRLAPDGGSLYYCCTAPPNQGLTHVALRDGKPVERLILPERKEYLSCQAISADGQMLAVRHTDQALHFLSADGSKDYGRLKREQSGYGRYFFSPDGKQLVGADRTILRIFDVPSGAEAWHFDVGADTRPGPGPPPIVELACSRDGKSCLTVNYRGVILWEAASGRERWRVPQTAGDVYALTFAPDGRLAALGSATGTVYVLDTATGAELGKFEGHRGAIHALDFSPDGRRLASGGDDGTVLVWDTAELSKKSRPAAAKLDAEQLENLWRDLGGADTAKAYRAVRALADAPEQGVPHFKAKVQGGGEGEAERIQRLIADLDSDDFATREKAHKELEGLGAAAVPEMRKALAAKPSVEVRTRLERLLEPFKDKNEVPGDRLREMRVVEALEYAGTAAAAELLKKLAAGDAKAPLTQDAKATLERLERRAAKP